jgi:hypothetical protein
MAAVGELISGRYRIVRPLADGGMARVWLADDLRHDRIVAIKRCVPPDTLAVTEQDLLRAWMLREARAFARVRHPNVIRTLDVLPDADPWLVMEYVPSRSLLQVIEESGPLPAHRVAAIGLAVLDGLAAAGRAGVLHLDVKPGNILIADDGRIVLTDFGPVVTGAGVDALVSAGIILASPSYVAPERVLGGVATERSDLWSLGATLYHAVEGHPPYVRATTAAMLKALVDCSPDPPGRAGALTPVLNGLLQRDPAARLTPAEVAERLRAVAVEESPATAPVEVRAPRRRRVLMTAALAAVTAVATVSVVLQAGGGTGTAGGSGGIGGGAQATGLPGSAPAAAVRTVALPRDFRWWVDPSGFRVAVPTGWRDSRPTGGGLLFTPPRTSPGGGPSLRISAWPAADDRNVVATLIAQEHAVRLPAYRRIRMEALPDPPDAVWEYTFHDKSAGPMRGLRRIVADGGRAYLIEWQAPKAAWTADLPSLAVVLDSFRPR